MASGAGPPHDGAGAASPREDAVGAPETPGGAAVASHPLTPLSPAEASAAVAAMRAELGSEALRFELVELVEEAAERRAYRHGMRGVHRLVVALPEGRVPERVEHAGAHPMIQLEQFREIEDAVKADPAFRTALALRGIDDADDACVDPWPGGSFGAPDKEGRHVSHGVRWRRIGEADNQHAHRPCCTKPAWALHRGSGDRAGRHVGACVHRHRTLNRPARNARLA
jgi:primary-amine oxidase